MSTHECSAHELKLPKQGCSVARPKDFHVLMQLLKQLDQQTHLKAMLCSIGRHPGICILGSVARVGGAMLCSIGRHLGICILGSVAGVGGNSGLLCSMPCHLCICHGADKEARRSEAGTTKLGQQTGTEQRYTRQNREAS